MTGSPILWVLSIEAEGLLFSVLINDVTVWQKRAATQVAAAEKINPLLVPGSNSVNVLIGSPAPSILQPPSPRLPAFALQIQQGPQGVDPGQEGVLVRFEWKPGQTSLTSGRIAPVFEQRFQVSELPWELPGWTRVVSIPVDRPALESFVRRYAEILGARDMEAAVELNRLKLQEQARSLGLAGEDLVRGFRSYLGALMSASDCSAQVARGLEYNLEGHARLIRITGQDGAAPITVVSDGRTIPFDLTVSLINGRWSVVR